jgi:drug/metabolite transporter (DMT)-like permease
MVNFLLYITPAFIWGSTWLVITFQLGVVDPLISVGYRFVLAGIILMTFCLMRKTNLRYTLRQHIQIALQASLLFGVNYWLVYMAEEVLPSGVVGVVFSSLVFLNIINGAIFLRRPIRSAMVIGACIGVVGITLVFFNELAGFQMRDGSALAFVFALLSAFSASFGNILSARNQEMKLPVVQTNAFGMVYGGVLMLLLAAVMGKQFNFDVSYTYMTSLAYLAIFGSIIAFTCYLSLVGRIGPDKAAYVTLIFPVVAMLLSTLFEDYRWTYLNLLGVGLILGGNFFIIQRKKPHSDSKTITAEGASRASLQAQ